MAKTSFLTANALTKKAWEEKLFRDARKESYFERFMGPAQTSLVQEKTVLEKSKGDKITFGIRMRLSGAGVTSGTQLEGNEEKLTTYDCSVSLEQYRHAVRDDGALTRQRAMFEIDDESRSALKDWMGEKIDQLCFDTLGIGSGSTGDPSKILYVDRADGVLKATASWSTAQTAVDDAGTYTSFLTLDNISALKTWAKTGGNRAYTPIRPVKVDGKEYFVILVNPDALYDLKRSSEWKQLAREADVRGKDNPLFTGAEAVYDGCIIHSHENVIVGTGSNAPYSRGLILGAQSLVFGWGSRPEVVSETFDYQNEHGYAIGMIAGVAKPVFNSKEYGSLAFVVARTAVSSL